uniref:VWFC domain-containing protein n=1 Tax=Lates calcarifer TaxID=8187 RepID=A0A4W6FSG8_LATCA
MFSYRQSLQSSCCILLLVCLLQTEAQDCSQPSWSWMTVGCCKVCARQLGEPCSLLEPCDHHKELYCDYALGESFQPSCKHHCVCMNGEIGCVPMCASDIRLPSPDCPYPHRIQIPGKCCEEWVSCKTNKTCVCPPVTGFRPVFPHGPLGESPRDNCIVQTTEWSECSATCGMAISSRITNDNQRCQLERQTRICMVRPCNSQQEKEIKVSLFPFKAETSSRTSLRVGGHLPQLVGVEKIVM